MRFLSLFSGIEAASAAWVPLGWECVGVAEIDPFPCAVLAHHYPDVPNLGSVTEITDADIEALGPIDLVVGGSPCQDLSVAGKRAGLDGERSGLFFQQARIFHAARSLCGARYMLWENVPGAFSSNGGRDFAAVVGTLAGAEFDVPRDGWRSAGFAAGPEWLVEWAVLDAQFFGVPQRRRRIFALLDTGDWSGRPPILLEPASLHRNSPEGRPSREDVATTLSSRPAGSGGLGTDFDLDGGAGLFVPDIVGALTAKGPGAMGAPEVDAGHYIMSSGQANAEISTDLCPTLNCLHEAPVVTHTLRAEHDASEDGTGRGVPLVPVAFAENSRSEVRLEGGDGSRTGALSTGGGKPGQGVPSIAYGFNWQNGGGYGNAHNGSRRHNGALVGSAVRRLTPRECERLQGFPDDHTRIPYRGKPAEQCPDGPRYKGLGNSMAVPVMSWIARRIEEVTNA